MSALANLSLKLKVWIKERPTLDMQEAVTWFLMSFVYFQGLSLDGPAFSLYYGIIPGFNIPTVDMGLALLCLFISVVVIGEPLLPYGLRGCTKALRRYPLWKYISKINFTVGFMFGFVFGLVGLAKNVPDFRGL